MSTPAPEYGKHITGFPFATGVIIGMMVLGTTMMVAGLLVVLAAGSLVVLVISAPLIIIGTRALLNGTLLYLESRRGNAVEVFEGGLLLRRHFRERFIPFGSFYIKDRGSVADQFDLRIQFSPGDGLTINMVQDAGALKALLIELQTTDAAPDASSIA